MQLLPQYRDVPARRLLLGAHPSAGGTRFGVFSTRARRCELLLVDQGVTWPMPRVGADLFEANLDGVGEGTRYKFVLDGRELPDPYARFLPDGVHGPAVVVASGYPWRHGPGVARPLREHIIYELHVGTFTDEGTYAGVRGRLAELAAMGFTAIELMPVAAAAGRRGWGYDGVAPFAPFAPYGTPRDLRALVDEAHGLGLSVFLDVVYNHFGPSGNYLAAYSPEYFTQAIQNAWGDAPDFAHPAMRRLVLENALYWLRDFRFDGLRLDATHAIIDPSPRHILRELADAVAELSPPRLLIGEDERNDPGVITALGLNGVWADDFHHQVRVTLTGERDGYYRAYEPGVAGIAETIRAGWLYRGQVYPPTEKPRGGQAEHLSADALVYCIQNHDQVGNRALGDRLSASVPPEAYAAASTLLLFLPMTPLVFMGQEWMASTPFLYFTDHEPELGRLVVEGRRAEFKTFAAFTDPERRAAIPDPQSESTFVRSKLSWSEREVGHHTRILQLYRRLLALRQTDPVLRASGRGELEATASGSVLRVRRWSAADERILIVNFGAAEAALDERDAGRPVLLATSASSPGALAPYEALILR